MNDFYDDLLQIIEKSTREMIFSYPVLLTHLEVRAKETGDPRIQALLDILPHIHAIRSELKQLGMFDANPR